MSEAVEKQEQSLSNSEEIQKDEKMNISIIPTVEAQEGDDEPEEEELVDPQETLRAECAEEHHAKQLFDKYQTCNDRVNSRSQTTETCVEELFDYLHVLDHCVTKDLFSKLK